MCCSVLQCVAVCCSVLQCVAVCCSVLQCVAECCRVSRPILRRVEVCCSVWQCNVLCKVSVYCSLLLSWRCQCIAVCCCLAVSCTVMQCVATRTHPTGFKLSAAQMHLFCSKRVHLACSLQHWLQHTCWHTTHVHAFLSNSTVDFHVACKNDRNKVCNNDCNNQCNTLQYAYWLQHMCIHNDCNNCNTNIDDTTRAFKP